MIKTRFLLILVLIACFSNNGLAQALSKSKKSKKTADSTTYILAAQDVNGQTSTTFNKQKKLNMLVFWASWCKPCRMIPVSYRWLSLPMNLAKYSVEWSVIRRQTSPGMSQKYDFNFANSRRG